MTWVDIVVLGVLAISALLAFLRGFVREVLGIGAWVGAAAVTWWGAPLARPHFAGWFAGSPDLVDPVTYATLFVVSLIVLLFASHWIGALVRGSVLGGLDRTLGLLFGLVRGAALVVFAYFLVDRVIPPERWPEPVRKAISTDLAFQGASWALERAWSSGRLPSDRRPHLDPPPSGPEITASTLLQALPLGHATGKPP
jgi:membrane protein required for colicin V production